MSEDPILTAIAKLGADLRTEIAALGDNLRGDLALLGTELRDEIAQNRAETAKLIEGVQTSVDGIREDLTVIGGANDHTRKLGDNTRDELRSLAELVAAMQRVLLKHGTRLDDLDRRMSGRA